MNKSLEILFDERLLTAECPTWDEKSGTLYFVDIRGKAFYTVNGIRSEAKKTDVPQLLGCLALCENSDVLLSMEDGIYRMDKNGKIALAHKPTGIKGIRFNDGKVGPDGCYYLGTKGDFFSGAFYRLSDGTLTELFDSCECSNGIDWSRDGKNLYYIDSPTQKVEKFDFSAEKHSLSNRRTVFTVPEDLGVGDGMAIDEKGNLWVAVWGGHCVLHIDPESGTLLDKIEIPAEKVSSCTFAGKNLDELIITTAAIDTEPEKDPHAGKVFVYRPGVSGMPINRYKF